MLQDLYLLVVEQACKAGLDKFAVTFMDKIRGKVFRLDNRCTFAAATSSVTLTQQASVVVSCAQGWQVHCVMHIHFGIHPSPYVAAAEQPLQSC